MTEFNVTYYDIAAGIETVQDWMSYSYDTLEADEEREVMQKVYQVLDLLAQEYYRQSAQDLNDSGIVTEIELLMMQRKLGV